MSTHRTLNPILRAAALAGTATLLASTAACTAHKEADIRTSPRVVRTAVLQSESSTGRSFTGVIAARVQSNIGFRVAGKITQRSVDVGQTVHDGQLLMRLDRTDMDHAIEAREGTVAAARARVLQATADEKRFHNLLTSGAVSVKVYEDNKTELDTAQALLAAAEAQSNVAKDDARYTQLTADADGVVVDVLAEPGQVVAAGQTVIKLAHEGPREAVVYLPETVRPAVDSLAVATLYSAASGGAPVPVTARLRQLSDAADTQTRTFEARYVLEADAAKAPLGATVTVRVPSAAVAGNRPEAFEVPVGALRDGKVGDAPPGAGVWIFDPKTSTVSFRKVNVERFAEETALVDGDLHAGESVVALGAHLLHDGETVQPEQAVTSR